MEKQKMFVVRRVMIDRCGRFGFSHLGAVEFARCSCLVFLFSVFIQ